MVLIMHIIRIKLAESGTLVHDQTFQKMIWKVGIDLLQLLWSVGHKANINVD